MLPAGRGAAPAPVDARAGGRRLFLLDAEPGIGKTRVADELAQRAVAAGARACSGAAAGRSGAPATGRTRVPRTYPRETPIEVAVAQMGAEARALARLSPWLREQLGVGAGAGEPEPARFGVFDSLTPFLHAPEELGEPGDVLPSLPEGRQREPSC